MSRDFCTSPQFNLEVAIHLWYKSRNRQRLAIHQLLSSGLADASELLLGGCSAGAVAAPLRGDYVAQTVRRAAAQRGRLKNGGNGGNGGNAEVDLWWFMSIYGDLWWFMFFLWYVMVLVVSLDFGWFWWISVVYADLWWSFFMLMFMATYGDIFQFLFPGFHGDTNQLKQVLLSLLIISLTFRMICGLGDGRKTVYTTPRKASKKLDTWDCPGMIGKAALPLAYWKNVSIFVGVTQKMFRPSGWTHWSSFCCFNFKWLLSTSHFYRIHLKIRLKLPAATGGFIAGGNVFVAILSDSGFFVDWSSLSRAPPGVLWLGPVMNCGCTFGVWIPMLGKIWQSVWSIHTVFY